MLTLHCAPNTISVASAIALHEADLPFKAVKLDFKTAEQTLPGYLAINPKGRVPALTTPDGILTETGAILEYIGVTAPGARLIPADLFGAARMREAMYYLASTMHPNHAHKMRGHRWADREESWADMKAKVPQTVAASCAYLEGSFLFDPFVTGKDLTLADPYLYTITTWLSGDGVNIADYPRLARFASVFAARPSVQAVRDMGLL
jgi:glutathione S-transferase